VLQEVFGPALDEIPGVDGQDIEIVGGVQGLLLGYSKVVFSVANAAVVFDVEVEFWQVEVWAERSSLAVVVNRDLHLVDEWDLVLIECGRYSSLAF